MRSSFFNQPFVGLYMVLLISQVLSATAIPYKAVVIYPVIDLVGDPLYRHITTDIMSKVYKQFPACTSHKTHDICPRIHQLLFNEVVEVIQEQGQEVHIKIPQLFYVTAYNSKPRTAFWTLKKNIMPLTYLENKKLNYAIPPQITFDSAHIPHKDIVTLILPWYDQVTHKQYSAGTRFVRCIEQTNSDSHAVLILDRNSSTVQQTSIPSTKCIADLPHNKSEKIELFLSLLKQWVDDNNEVIPYVWGGCSFTTMHEEHFQEKQMVINKKKVTFFSRKHETPIKSGFDCAGLIARAAQIAGIPYFFKNTTTASYYLHALSEHDAIESGDLLWIPGHVMVIANIHTNTLIEARSYEHGYGKVQAIHIKHVFQGVHSIRDLYSAYLEKKPLQRMDKAGTIRETFSDWKILKLSSTWSKKS